MCYLYIVGTKDLQTKQEKDKMVSITKQDSERIINALYIVGREEYGDELIIDNTESEDITACSVFLSNGKPSIRLELGDMVFYLYNVDVTKCRSMYGLRLKGSDSYQIYIQIRG